MSVSQTHVLVVDDEAVLSRALAKELRVDGFAATPVSKFFDAVSLIHNRTVPIDVLLTDVILDVGNGLTLSMMARHVRPEIETIFFSAYARPPDCNDVPFLRKPVSGDVLGQTIRTVSGGMSAGVRAYLQNAEECERLARSAKTDDERRQILAMATTWRLLAARRKANPPPDAAPATDGSC